MPGEQPGGDPTAWTSQDCVGWYEARNAMVLLRDALLAAGLAKDFPYLRADLNAFGQGIVELGRTTPAGAQRIAELINAGLFSDPSQVGRGRDGRAS